jgi:hypothetical protein
MQYSIQRQQSVFSQNLFTAKDAKDAKRKVNFILCPNYGKGDGQFRLHPRELPRNESHQNQRQTAIRTFGETLQCQV